MELTKENIVEKIKSERKKVVMRITELLKRNRALTIAILTFLIFSTINFMIVKWKVKCKFVKVNANYRLNAI